MIHAHRLQYLIVLSIIFLSFTFLNKLAIILLPLLIILLYIICADKGTHFKLRMLLIMAAISLLYNIFREFYFINHFASFICVISFFLMFHISVNYDHNVAKKLLRIFTYLMVLQGAIGVIQFLVFRYDDAFIGFYGRGGLQGHGLAIVYCFLSVFYFSGVSIFERNKSLLISIFFFICFVLCFYGSGLFYFFLAILIASPFRKNLASLLFIFPLIIFSYIIISWLNPKVIYYNTSVLLYFYDSLMSYYAGFVSPGTPRRLSFMLDFFNFYFSDPSWMLFGIGGGSFNSRISFLFNGDYSSFDFLPIARHSFAENLVFIHWNRDLTTQLFSDGSMNQPFSSFISLLAEYGIFFTFALLYFVLLKIFNTVKIFSLSAAIFFVSYLSFLIMFENIIEYLEVVICLFLLMQYFKSCGRSAKF